MRIWYELRIHNGAEPIINAGSWSSVMRPVDLHPCPSMCVCVCARVCLCVHITHANQREQRASVQPCRASLHSMPPYEHASMTPSVRVQPPPTLRTPVTQDQTFLPATKCFSQCVATRRHIPPYPISLSLSLPRDSHPWAPANAGPK